MEIEIGAMRLEEAETVAELARTVWHAHYPAIISPAQIDYMLAQRYKPGLIRQTLARGDRWDVARAGGELVGFAHAYPVSAGDYKLDKLYVHPDWQRHGIGARLLARVEAHARDRRQDRLILRVNRQNSQAIAAYLKYGFEVATLVVEDIGGGFMMDDYVMIKELRMPFANPTSDEIRDLLKRVKTIAVVGLSPKSNRPSYQVSQAMQRFGYRIIPIRPGTAEVLGETCYPSLAEVPERIDLVDVFRAAEHIPAVVDECLAIGAPAIWIQEGIVHDEAAAKARAAGLTVVMDRCIYKDYLALME